MTINKQPASPFFALPPEIRKRVIYPYLPLHTLSVFSQTCHVAVEETRISRLLHVTAHAKPISYDQTDKSKLAAEIILTSYPALLFEKGTTIDPAGNIIYGSAWQIAWATGDVWMLKMMMTFIPRIEYGTAIAKTQYAEQFAGCDKNRHDTRNKAQLAELKEDLQRVVGAISVDLCKQGKATKQETTAAIQTLKEHLTPKKNEVIKTGTYSPPEILKHIYDMYAHCWTKSNWSGNQFALYSREILGSAERIVAAVDAQRYKKGLQHYSNEHISPDRTDSYFKPGGTQKLEDLGSAYAYSIYTGQVRRGNYNFDSTWIDGTGPTWTANVLQNYIDKKQSFLTELEQQLEQLYQQNKKMKL